MKRIEVRLSLAVVAPLLDVIKATGDSLQTELAAPNTLGDIEPDLRDDWRSELLESQNSEVRHLLALFDNEFFANGVIAFDGSNAEPVVRACAAVRLKLRETYLTELNEDLLESGEIEIEELPEPGRKAFMCYLFLATIQELIIQHLDSSILDN
ncbi:MAG TPA: hypothetical protein PLN52_15880 [Opitutaceae bacterium]|nr:hypothetical protein [Opitutaceae bacterium]